MFNIKFIIYLLLISIVTFLIIESVNRHTVDPTIKKLLEAKLIEGRQVKELETIIEEIENKSKAAYLLALSKLENDKFHGGPNFGFPIHYYSYTSFDPQNPTEVGQKKINNELLNYLVKLNTSHLISEKLYDIQLDKIRNNDYIHLLQMLEDVSNQAVYEEWINPENIVIYAEKLLDNKIINEKAAEKLRDDALKNMIASHHQILDYFNNAVFIDLEKHSNDPSIYLGQIHKEVATLLPELQFANFSYKIEMDPQRSYSEHKAYKVIVMLETNRNIYRQSSAISLDETGQFDNYLNKIEGGKFYQIFNKILEDNESEFRIHQISPKSRSIYSEHQIARDILYEKKNNQGFGIIALKEQQVDALRISDPYFDLSREDYNNGLTSSRIDSAISGFKDIGLLDHLTEDQIIASIEKINEYKINGLNDILHFFPDVVHFYDLELNKLQDPYVELLKKYSKITRGEFNPTHISDDFNKEESEKVTLKFTHNNKNYVTDFQKYDDWIVPEFSEFLSKFFSENNFKGHFYYLQYDGQYSIVIYLTPYQYQFIVANNLLVFDGEGRNEG